MRLDPFQQQAIQYINEGFSVIVSAPTGSGKTLIAEHVIQDCLRTGRKIIYTAPIKALSNQKFRDFQADYPDQIGILTGDVTINPGAPTLIMTTEIFRNKVINEPLSLNDYSWIIFDEIHYLDDEERGTVWEESLIFLPRHMRLLGLSATIPNIAELAGWLKDIHQLPVKTVTSGHRPVPLHFFYQCQGHLFDNLKALKKEGYHGAGMDRHSFRGGRLPKDIPVKPNKLSSLVNHMVDNDLLPCIYFVFSRRRTEYLAAELLGHTFLNPGERAAILQTFDSLCEKFEITDELSARELRPFIERGIAYHHAGMLPTLKEIVERLFTTRKIRMIFTTETFALGINMPAKTVAFDELRKFYGRSFRALKTRDFFQMAGRAGRRGIDTEGYVFSRINPHYLSFGELEHIIFREPEKVSSRFNASYATLLSLYQTFGEELYNIYPKSFHHFQEQKQSRKKALRQLRDKVLLLKQLGHIRKGHLTAKGLFASKIYGYELVLSELYETGELENLSLYQLGVLLLAVVYEPRKGLPRPELDKKFLHLERLALKTSMKINRIEQQARISPESKPCAFHLSAAIEAWMKGSSFAQVLQLTECDEGEIIRYFRMTMQVGRELLDTPVNEQFKTTLWTLINKINRDVIDAEKQLRA